ncbi:hypothetical protein HanRHA438_Chr02g0090681 [Helianthus annuus]|nr:putative reticulon-like protein B17/18/21 [Helianthus annuus]KAJ0619746.1 putative reticulon-like protein B17/18/21 [Helianthus annuus]KAJ0787194.1 putative reticulon-like protein B17/18/21 [Helianthus annuus]KAJ0941091.1 hypothetical protein HanRHA438_Chr02g0090681 [Helianthus annuus]
MIVTQDLGFCRFVGVKQLEYCIQLMQAFATMFTYQGLNLLLISDSKVDYRYDFHRIGTPVNDLMMWNDAAKSTLWFGLGSFCFLPLCFTTE